MDAGIVGRFVSLYERRTGAVMTLPGTCPSRVRNHSKNGSPNSCPESYRTDNPLSETILFGDHGPEKALEIMQMNRVDGSRGLANENLLVIVNAWTDRGAAACCVRGETPEDIFGRCGKRARLMSANEKVNILMVDKRAAKLRSYEVMLRELGENLITARSAEEALERLLQTDVAVVLLGVDGPETDAFKTARRSFASIQALRKRRSSSFWALSNYSREGV
jgi:CheY-like chemotaxis protein